jgi:hypothetical protein
MKTIGSHPGAILFRMSIMVILVAIVVLVFFSYLGATEREFERASIVQTKKIIDSSLAVIFATYAVKGNLNGLNSLDGANPFTLLSENQINPLAYRGDIDTDVSRELEPGWYYLLHRNHLVYVSRYLETDFYYKIDLVYEDIDNSGRFESDTDTFQYLRFVSIGEVEKEY